MRSTAKMLPQPSARMAWPVSFSMVIRPATAPPALTVADASTSLDDNRGEGLLVATDCVGEGR